MNKKIVEQTILNQVIEQAILNHVILELAKTCKNKEDDGCNGCILSKYDCPFPDLNYDIEKENFSL